MKVAGVNQALPSVHGGSFEITIMPVVRCCNTNNFPGMMDMGGGMWSEGGMSGNTWNQGSMSGSMSGSSWNGLQTSGNSWKHQDSMLGSMSGRMGSGYTSGMSGSGWSSSSSGNPNSNI